MRIRRSVFAVASLFVLAGFAPGAAAVAAVGDRAARLKRELGQGVRVAEHRETGKVRFVGTEPGKPISRPAGLSASAPPKTVARTFFERYGDAFGIRDQAHELRATASQSATAGRSAVRFQQLREGVPILGGELVVNLDADRNVLSASGESLPAAGVATSPRVGSAAARDAAIAAVAKEHGVAAFRLDADIPSLWIYDARILGGPGPGRPVLIWRLDVKGEGGLPIDDLVLVDAALGSVALRVEQIENAKNRSVCDAANAATQYPCTAPVASESNPPAPPDHTDVGFAFDYAGDTYDFFFGLGRDSLDGQGLQLKSTVRYCDPASPCPYQNAFWDGQQMVYGEGFAAADDVVGHELTHGVTDFSARLFYYYQSGAINESLSDVFGEFVDLTNGAGNDNAAVRWQLGEDVPGGGAVRNMADPPVPFGDPDRMTSPNYTSDPNEQDSGGVHTNSGVNNKAAFLMTDGGTFNGRTVTGLGIPKVSRIYYEVQTGMLTSASNYADLNSALQQACTNLVGTAGITSADCGEVTDAVAAVEMSTVPPAAPNPEAPVCPSGLVPTDLFSDDLENPGSGNWTTQPSWFYPQNPNGVFDATYATSGTRNIWGYDRPSTGDFSITMNPSVVIPVSSTAFLRFNHAHGFEDDSNGAYDGGMLEISVNGDSFVDIGSLLTDGGYNGTISTVSNNPLEGRSAFVRESNGYQSSRAALTSLAGQSVRFRFRIGTDSSVDDYGWFIDDVRIYTCAPPPPPDADGDGVPDASDACPTTPAATANGCPASTGGGTGGGTGGSGGGSAGGGGIQSGDTLQSARVRSCRRTGRGRRARVVCSLTRVGAVSRVSMKVTRRGRTAASGSARPSPRGTVAIRARRTLRRGIYRVTLTLRDASGATRRLSARLRVR
ncbi:MAG TPA: M4 family metallopeptidase [Solirubrobacteraceae bacterium]|nr:M4 family metallopeptidase [Solirubrobacteraceae bacterium]